MKEDITGWKGKSGIKGKGNSPKPEWKGIVIKPGLYYNVVKLRLIRLLSKTKNKNTTNAAYWAEIK